MTDLSPDAQRAIRQVEKLLRLAAKHPTEAEGIAATNKAQGVISQSQTRARGLSRFFTGTPCRNGHVAERMSSSSLCVVCYKEGRKRWRGRHRDKVNERTRRQYGQNPGKWGTRIKHWRKNNPSLLMAQSRRHRAKRRGALGHHTAADIERLFYRQRGRCANHRCNAALIFGYDVDHKTPLSRGGSNWPRNLQLLCASCNSSKGDKTQYEWENA